MKFINKNVYIQCAITSNSFCICAKDAFFLILRDPFLFAIAGGMADIFVFLGKMFIGAGTSILMYFGMKAHFKENEVENPFGPLVVIALISYLTGSMFMGVWGMAVDTIL